MLTAEFTDVLTFTFCTSFLMEKEPILMAATISNSTVMTGVGDKEILTRKMGGSSSNKGSS